MQNGKKVATVNDKNNKDWETRGENISFGNKIPINKLFEKSGVGNNKKPLPKGIAYGTIRGHFLNRLNNDKETLTQGKIVKIMAMKSLPSSDIKAMQTYKKLVAKG